MNEPVDEYGNTKTQTRIQLLRVMKEMLLPMYRMTASAERIEKQKAFVEEWIQELEKNNG